MTYLLRAIDPELWAAVRARATGEGRTIRYILLTLLQRYVQQGLPKGSKEQ
jgi:hypothetical protein